MLSHVHNGVIVTVKQDVGCAEPSGSTEFAYCERRPNEWKIPVYDMSLWFPQGQRLHSLLVRGMYFNF
jgi:hypothetical protein